MPADAAQHQGQGGRRRTDRREQFRLVEDAERRAVRIAEGLFQVGFQTAHHRVHRLSAGRLDADALDVGIFIKPLAGGQRDQHRFVLIFPTGTAFRQQNADHLKGDPVHFHHPADGVFPGKKIRDHGGPDQSHFLPVIQVNRQDKPAGLRGPGY